MEDPHNSTQESLEDFLKRHPHIKYVTPYSPDYAYAGTTFIVNNAKPLAIVRPQTSSDVAALILYATSNGIKLVIRSGGHDLFGRSKIEGTLMVDMRDIKFVEVDSSQQSAKIGGGIIANHLAYVLSQHGLTTAFGTVADVGYVGWATLGGYGLFTANYGLGVDQIVSAKVINWEGQVVDAGERMLQGIRGAGGNFGVIVELGVKVYPEPKMFGGTIFYDSLDISKAFKEYVKAYREMDIELSLPESLPLAVQPFVRNTLLQGRKSFGVELCWTGHGQDETAAQTGQNLIQKFANLGMTIESTVKSTTPADWLREHASPSGLYGGLRTISIRNLTDQVTEIIGRYLEIMPEDPATGFSLHQLRGPAASPNPNSVFGVREPHFVLEFIATTITEVKMRASLAWAEEFRSALLQSDPENLLQGEYVPLSPPGTVPVSRMYGPYYEKLRELKQEFDPKGIFDLAVPRLGN